MGDRGSNRWHLLCVLHLFVKEGTPLPSHHHPIPRVLEIFFFFSESFGIFPKESWCLSSVPRMVLGF